MPRICCIPDCRYASDYAEGRNLSFFKFPKDEMAKKKWQESIKQHYGEIKFTKTACICNLHFGINCFQYGGLCQIVRLKKESIPTIFNVLKFYERQILPEQHSLQLPSNHELLEKEIGSLETEKVQREILQVQHSFQLPSHQHLEEEHCSVENGSLLTEGFNNFEKIEIKTLNADKKLTDHLESIQSHSLNSDISDTSELNESMSDSLCSCSIKTDHGSKNSINKLKSVTSVDINAIKNLKQAKTIIKKAQNEVSTLRKKLRSKAMQHYRIKKKITDPENLIKHLSRSKLISEEVVKHLTVSKK